MRRIGASILALLPGIGLAAAVAVPSVVVNEFVPPLSAVAVAMVVGLLVRNLAGLPQTCGAGTKFVTKRVLRLAIILLGIRLSFSEMVRTGLHALLIIVCCITIAILLVQWFSRLLKLPARLGTLIGVGTSICGNSAIMATAPAIDAEDEETSFAVATISLFGVMAVLVYPLIGHVLDMTNTTFGAWAGTAINDTSQVVTAGFIYSEPAGKVATVVKLTRNLFMAPVIVVMGVLYHRGQRGRGPAKKLNLAKAFPLFVLGFVLMAVVRTLDVLPAAWVGVIKTTSSYLVVLSIAAVGLNTSFRAMRKIGLRPFYVGLLASILMGGVSFALIRLLYPR